MRSVFKKSIFYLGIAAIIFCIGFFPAFIQKYYSTGLYNYISALLRFISSWFPFAIGDILYALLLLYVLYKVVYFFKIRKRLSRNHRIMIPLHILNFVLILYILFKVVWGLNYSRPSISESLGIGNQKYTVKELVTLGAHFVARTNALKLKSGKMPSYTIAQLENFSATAYQGMANQDPVFNYPNPCLKAVLMPWLTSKAGIEGYYAPLSGEANMNMNLPDFVKPYVSCHEIAHQLGIAYEDEANLLGYLTASKSDNIHYQYSANYEMLRYILFEIRMKSPEDYKRLHEMLLPEVLADFKTEKEFWRKYNGEMFGYMDAAFDRFLKLNNQQKGINSYQDIVIWLWNIYKKEQVDSQPGE